MQLRRLQLLLQQQLVQEACCPLASLLVSTEAAALEAVAVRVQEGQLSPGLPSSLEGPLQARKGMQQLQLAVPLHPSPQLPLAAWPPPVWTPCPAGSPSAWRSRP